MLMLFEANRRSPSAGSGQAFDYALRAALRMTTFLECVLVDDGVENVG